MYNRKYCEKWNSYYVEDKWIEATGCGKNKSCKKCMVKCYERPNIPCKKCIKCQVDK